jgi:inhibitor of cysteine peptidase
MKKTLFVVVLILTVGLVGVVTTACAAPDVEPTPSPQPDMEEPVSSEDDTPTPQEPAGAQPGDYETDLANVEQVDVMILESFPVQVRVTASGNLPNGCTEIDEVDVAQEGQTFDVTITTRRPLDQECTEALVPFEETFPLDVLGLAAGTYVVDVNGVTGTFELAVDNVSPTEDLAEPDGGEIVYGMAHVQNVEVRNAQSASQNPEVIIQGYLGDACTELGSISDELSGSTIRVTVETRRPADAVCAQIIEAFETTYTLTSVPGPGTYTVDVNGVRQQFTVN